MLILGLAGRFITSHGAWAGGFFGGINSEHRPVFDTHKVIGSLSCTITSAAVATLIGR